MPYRDLVHEARLISLDTVLSPLPERAHIKALLAIIDYQKSVLDALCSTPETLKRDLELSIRRRD
jgi:hypothetical protein